MATRRCWGLIGEVSVTNPSKNSFECFRHETPSNGVIRAVRMCFVSRTILTTVAQINCRSVKSSKLGFALFACMDTLLCHR